MRVEGVYKVLLMGPMGSGKTTAINHLCAEDDKVSTEAENFARSEFDKDTTTVGVEYVQLELAHDIQLHLYGCPGQERFSFVWESLVESCDGIILLVNHEQPDCLQRMSKYLEFIELHNPGCALCIGVSRVQCGRVDMPLVEYEKELQKFKIKPPIFFVDVRLRSHSIFLLESIICQARG